MAGERTSLDRRSGDRRKLLPLWRNGNRQLTAADQSQVQAVAQGRTSALPGLEKQPLRRSRATQASTTQHIAYWPVLAAAVLVMITTFMVQAYRLDRAPDVFADEMTYFFVGKSISLGQIPREYWFQSQRVFFWQPPLYMLIETPVIKLTNIASADIFTAIHTVRYLNVAIASMTSALIFILGKKLRSRVTGLVMSALFLLDPFLLRSIRRNLLEICVMFFVVLGILILSRYPKGLDRSGTIGLGIVFGLVLITKEVAFYILALPAVFLFFGQPRHFLRHIPSIVGGGIIGLIVYSIYPIWALLVGAWGDFLAVKSFQLQRFGGFVQFSGWNRSVSPGFFDALQVNLPQYGSSYVLILLSGILTLYFLRYCREDDGARLLASWNLVTDVYFAFVIKHGQLNDQFFYLQLVATVAIVGYSIPLFFDIARRQRSKFGFGLVAVPLFLVLLFNTVMYYRDYVVGVDNGLEEVYRYVRTHIPPGTPLLLGGGDEQTWIFSNIYATSHPVDILYSGGPDALHRVFGNITSQAVQAKHIHYVIVSSKDAWGHFDEITPEFYNWVMQNSVHLFAVDELTSWHLGVYYVRYPDQGSPG